MYSKGDIVIVNFPFSDLINAKKRPILVLAEYGQDIIGCAITSNPESDGVPLDRFEQGILPLKSKVKYWQIATFLKDLAIKKIAKIDKKIHTEILNKINNLFEI